MSGPLVFAGLIWLTVVIGFAAAWRFAPQRDPVEERLRAYGWQPGVDLEDGEEGERRQKYPLTQRLLMGLGLGPALAKALMRADVPMTAAEFTLVVLLVVALGCGDRHVAHRDAGGDRAGDPLWLSALSVSAQRARRSG